jgi:hypothetical protein
MTENIDCGVVAVQTFKAASEFSFRTSLAQVGCDGTGQYSVQRHAVSQGLIIHLIVLWGELLASKTIEKLLIIHDIFTNKLTRRYKRSVNH